MGRACATRDGVTSLFAFVVFGCAATALYLAGGFGPLDPFFALAIAAVSTWAYAKISGPWPALAKPKDDLVRSERLAYRAAACVSLAGITVAFALARTDVGLASPWLAIPGIVFLGVGVAAFSILQLRADRWAHALTAWAVTALVGVSAVVYAVGFGFDPFLHRAAETAIAKDGVIEPLRLLYAGQYATVVAIARLTFIPVKLVDVFLVPALVAVLFPFALRRAAGTPVAALAALAIPFSSLTFTVPYNLAVWAFALVVALAGIHTRGAALLRMILAAFAFLCHPLIGLPALAYAVTLAALGRFGSGSGRWASATLAFLAFVTAVPFALARYVAQSGGVIHFWDMFMRTDLFKGLFLDPFVHDFHPIPWHWEALYAFRTYAVPVIAVGALIMAVRRVRKGRDDAALAFIVFMLGTFVSLWFTSTVFEFVDIINYEQLEFALRALNAMYLAAAVAGATWIFSSPIAHNRRFLTASALAVMVPLSWYFSYPQLNAKSVFPAQSVSRADVEAVREIERRNVGTPYLVLSNQMMSAAAVETLGFAHEIEGPTGTQLWYAIPTGGELYRSFEVIAYDGASPRDTLARAAALYGVPRAYLAIPRYWFGSNAIAGQASAEGLSAISVNDGEIIIFEYEHPNESR
ncbi:hypothetical protein A2856_02780 [Candidatus Uhrbacteria bacterium RIFCSPHIGHO2_01_FULL_63_20]|uniref:Glycosyltransferase RgtA/B/C/D-like domain-containing protein n=1 Tax=Candidatus Uhrbacteria bacterium RIFCSPHIGHO2_01_FULL_63_20 TaxID=1802385 RepID=A0A1F7TKP3_9BACT|nr:MAG: hypothetical protein A2856_02780 [Candidatus Uhrbacteria bacterium RIFCSPHIGHO2_01_FULL_63_20]